jgi:endonuclease/exonuclease/phosphatase family metal-dependent hydrolase
MAPDRPGASLRGLLPLVVLASVVAASPAWALRIVNYNVTNYSSTSSARDVHFRTILAPLGADVLVTQEMTGSGNSGVDLMRDDVLNVLEPGQWASAPFFNGNDTDNALFYKPARVQVLGAWAFYPNPANLLRYVTVWRLRPAGYANAELRIYSQHLKASSGSANEAQRHAEAIGIRDSMNAVPPGTHAILLGDFNIYSNNELAFQKLLEAQTDNDGRLYDPLNLVVPPGQVWNQSAFQTIHTQSPCNSGCPGGFATGGLDDRFDMFLPTLNMNDGQGTELLIATYRPVGNDGLHYNKNITDAPTIPEGAAYATALFSASDHLPIRVDLQMPAKLLVAGGPLAFGSVIVGAGAAQNVTVSNPAVAPADMLDYSFAAPAGFTAPAGAFAVAPGAAAVPHAIGIDTGAPGARAGSLIVSGDDVDQPTVAIALSGTVLDHAAPSLDSLAVLTGGTLDLGEHEAGAFEDLGVRVHNAGYGALRARLSLTTAGISGGAGRFAIVGGFDPALLAGTGRTVTVRFDDAGATADSTYAATLTIPCADEPLPGATALAPLTVALSARLAGGTVGVPGAGLPSLTRLFAPAPNPLVGSSLVRFDLAAGARVRLEVFDLSGRRIATLDDGERAAGHHAVRWNGRGDDGSAADPGLYFVRLTGREIPEQTVRLAVVH